MRLITSHTLIVVICLIIFAVVVSVLLQDYRDQIVIERLREMSRPIYLQVLSLVKGQVPVAEVWTNLQEQAQKNLVHILMVDNKGKVIRQVAPEEESNRRLIDPAPTELPLGITEGTYGTFKTSTGQTYLFAAYPVRRLFNVRETAPPFDTLVVSTMRTGNIAIWASLVRPMLQAGLPALAISLLIAILLARSVYRPVRRVTAAAEKIAQGQYDQEIPVDGPKEIKGLALRFNEMAEKVKQSQYQLRHFVADVSHQLKSPLTSIQGFAQAMLDGTADDNASKLKAAQVISDESKRMIRQVDELLELSRMQSGQVQMARELVDIKELLLHCQEIFTMRAEDNDVLLRTEIEPLMPVVGDIDSLEHVFCNLLDNALKNSTAKGEVSIVGRNIDNDSIEVRITDNGPGISPEQLPYLFERFYQAGGLRTGTGLGLAIAREIVLVHNGKIEASSMPGEGAEFTVTLPVAIKDVLG
jgi:signal transduction histidine kinase